MGRFTRNGIHLTGFLTSLRQRLVETISHNAPDSLLYALQAPANSFLIYDLPKTLRQQKLRIKRPVKHPLKSQNQVLPSRSRQKMAIADWMDRVGTSSAL